MLAFRELLALEDASGCRESGIWCCDWTMIDATGALHKPR